MHETTDGFNYVKIPVHVVCNDSHVIFAVLAHRHQLKLGLNPTDIFSC